MDYKRRIVVSGDVIEYYNYSQIIKTGIKRKKRKRKSLDINLFNYQNFKRTISDKSINRTKTNIRRLICSNPDLTKFITLTHARDIRTLKESNKLFQSFIKRLKYFDKGLKYIAIPEVQPNSKRIHYHLLINSKYIPNRKLRHLWQNGFVNIRNIYDFDSYRLSLYLSKYLTKEFSITFINKKKYFTSQNLNKPKLFYDDSIYSQLSNLNNLNEIYQKIFNSDFIGKTEYNIYKIT